jgi:uncharacterized membrane protein
MKTPTDQELDISIARMLLLGITLSAIVVLIGAVLELYNSPLQTPDYAHFHAIDAPLRSIKGVVHSAWHFNAYGMIQFGLMLLIATPILRVLFCVVGFARQRDKLYVAISGTVLTILIYSLARVSL